MITCKEDLMNTYIENDFGELRRAYVDKAIELGYVHEWDTVRSYGWYDLPYIGINRNWSLDFIGQTSDVTRGIRDTKSKLLTLSDLKPTPTKFVKVEESIFDLKGEFERGELYEKGSDYTKLISESDFAFAYRENAVYRQVETDWRDEVVDLFGGGLIRRCGEGFQIGGVSMPSLTLVKLSHAIASLTEKPEGV